MTIQPSLRTLALLVSVVLASAAMSAASLEEDFRNPPVAARPYVWWHWMGPNFSEAGITKDLEAMKASGIGGATIFNLTSAVQSSHSPTANNPWPDQTYRSAKYWSALHHAAAEAERLGLEIGLHNSVGYSTTGGPWIDESRSMQRLVWSSEKVTGGAAVTLALPVPPIPPFTGWGTTNRALSWFRDVAVLAVPAERSEIAPTEVIDLSGQLSPTGELHWNAPPGNWIVYRLGHASTGASPHPVPDELVGQTLEADKMSLAQTRFHWSNVITPIQGKLGPLFGKSFRHFLIDSYEAGYQSWTPGFREEFKRRKGYDPLPWLATMGPGIAGKPKDKPLRTVGGAQLTDRFEYDYRDLIATLYRENGWEPAAAMIHAAGAKLQMEPYGGPFNTVEGAALADLPMVEFWSGRLSHANPGVIGGARAAGRTIIGAEAFTGSPLISNWTETPGSLKAAGDAMFADGVNRMVLHHWVHQPFEDRYKPGMGMGWWGTHFGRHQTWFEPGAEFFRYLGRIQALLQRGETPVDVVSVGAPCESGDVMSVRTLLDGARVDGRQLVLPSGRRYALLYVPHHDALLPEVLRKMEKLLETGATVVARRPTHSPSLVDYPACDAEVQALAAKLWGDGTETVRRLGRGTLYTDGDVDAARRDLALTPPAQILEPNVGNVRVAHRRDGAAELFFIANGAAEAREVTASFRVTDRQPELWDPETGAIQSAPVWRAARGRTEVDFPLAAGKSLFVVFQKALATGDHLTSIDAPAGWSLTCDASGGPVVSTRNALDGAAVFASGRRVAFSLPPALVTPVADAWTVELRPMLGPRAKITLPSLASLSSHENPEVRYFSGTAVYRTTVTLDAASFAPNRRIILALGDVRDLVRVTVNGRSFGVLWHPPFSRDVTGALHPGENVLELAVTNTWHNRLVGDEQYPADFEVGPDAGPGRGHPLKAYPEWFLKNTPRPSADRRAFVTWFYHAAETPLLPAGLLGPIEIVSEATQPLVP